MEVQPGDDLLQQGPVRRRPASTRRTRRWPPTTSSSPPADKIVDSKAAQSAIYPAPTQRVLPVLVRLLPAVRRRDRRQAAGRGRQGHVRRRRRAQAVANFWQQMYAEKLAPQGEVQRRLVRRRQGRHGDRRPVGDRGLRATRSTGASSRCRPRPAQPADQIHTFTDAKNVGDVLRLQEPGHRLGLPEVRHQQGAGRQAAGRDRPDAAAHRPARPPTPTTSPRTPTTSCSPTRPRAPSRCPTCRTRSRSGRRSATRSRSRSSSARSRRRRGARPAPRRRSTSSPAVMTVTVDDHARPASAGSTAAAAAG